MLGLVREHGRPGDVADGIEAGDVGAADAVGDDEALLELDAQRLEAEPVDVADDADGGDQPLGGDALALAVARARWWR